MIHTNRCKHCNKTKEEHWSSNYSCADNIYPTTDDRVFIDSGLAALDAHKEELYEAIVGYFSGLDNYDIDKERVYEMELRSILNQIENEK